MRQRGKSQRAGARTLVVTFVVVVVLISTAIAVLLSRFVTAGMRRVGTSTTALSAAADELASVSAQMTATAEETATQSDVVSAATTQFGANLATVATSAEEMSASIREIAENPNSASTLADTAVRDTTSTTEVMTRLAATADDIGDVTKLINSIAEQTNLLALNATIEAARAGEAGRGSPWSPTRSPSSRPSSTTSSAASPTARPPPRLAAPGPPSTCGRRAAGSTDRPPRM